MKWTYGYVGDKTFGLGLIDGKKASRNETTGKRKILPMNENVSIEITVRPGSIQVTADQTTIIDWKSDTQRFTMNPLWVSPNKDWIHIGSYLSEFETTELTLQPLKN